MNASYAIDVFGGTRRQVEASAATAEYQRFELEAAYLTLTSNVVTAVVQEASLRGQIEATLDLIKIESDELVVVRHQFEVGAAARTDVLTQQSEVATAQATLPPLQKQLEQQRHVILALTGRFPNEAAPYRLTLASMRLPTDLPLSLPSELIEQRPDIRAAEAQLHQASAQIGVAIANMLPKITLTADYGTAALTTASMFTPATAVWTLAASGTQPLFHGFTLLHQERAAKAAYEEADAQYRSIVLSAFQNVADALRALQLDAATLRAQRNALRAASDTLDLARGQYRLGAITYITLLNAQRSYQQARLAVVQAQAARFADTAALFQALGGGWWNRTDALPDPFSPEANAVDDTLNAPTDTAPSTEPINDETHGDHARRRRRRSRRIFGFQVFKGIMIKRFMSALSNPPQTVSTIKAAYSAWQPSIEAIGSLRAVNGADLSLEVSGVVGFNLVQFRRRCRSKARCY